LFDDVTELTGLLSLAPKNFRSSRKSALKLFGVDACEHSAVDTKIA